ncbi:exosome complex component RRP45 isoform X1 [Octopus sinensis]|uniref:Exosome complex component RRP45 n=1 Tax=Octopus sinensis TaxID=2607531 RepID=A0A6P7SLG2_9MOLL|nr:exosome complex component RRP45 isoform X1 [Octopus sinensis]
MRESHFSTCERNFILQSISKKLRIDGRQPYDYRRLKITFGVERGCCQVELGKTRVLAQVTATVGQPKPNRPTDGILFVNVELSPMASPAFEPGRLSEFGVYVNRLMERCLKESRCLDTESLCIVAGEKVWIIRIDLHVLNHDGNLIDSASIAAITSLAHFRRPDVEVSGDEVTVYPVEEREPIALSLHHMPICVSFAFFQEGKYVLVDPTEKEEKVMDGKMVIGMNKYREICTLQMAGDMLLMHEQILRCSNIAVVKVTEITELIQKALENDKQARATGAKFGFAESMEPQKITAMKKNLAEVNMENLKSSEVNLLAENISDDSSSESSSDSSESIRLWGAGTAKLGRNSSDISSSDDNSEVMELSPPHPAVAVPPRPAKPKSTLPPAESDIINIDDDSEDDVKVIQKTPDFAQKDESSGDEAGGQKLTLRELLMALKKKKCSQ